MLATLLLLLPLVDRSRTATGESTEETANGFKTNGDIMIGGLFPVHHKPTAASTANQSDQRCGHIQSDKGIQRMEAMVYAVSNINANHSLLPGVRLGMHILDTCASDTHALEQTLEFIKTAIQSNDKSDSGMFLCDDGSTPTEREDRVAISAVIGAASSQVSVMVASILRLFHLPQISYSSTGAQLSEKPRFNYFSRVVPSDNLQAQAMADLAVQLNWTYVNAIADESNYGKDGIENFRKFAQLAGVCMQKVHYIADDWSTSNFTRMLREMRKENEGRTRGVVMFVSETNVNKMLTALQSLSTSDSSFVDFFTFVGSDSWGSKQTPIRGVEAYARGAITIAPDQVPDVGFSTYFRSLHPSHVHDQNPWFAEFWQSNGCSTADATVDDCLRRQGRVFTQESYVPYVVRAVNILARALHEYIVEECGYPFVWAECALSRQTFNGDRLQSLYRNRAYDGGKALMDANGDGVGEYNIYQFVHRDGHYEYDNIGKWEHAQLSLDLAKMTENIHEMTNDASTSLPSSYCSDDCRSSENRQYQMGSQCCWTCSPCTTQILHILVNTTTCDRCAHGMLPNDAKDGCVPMIAQTIGLTSPWAILPALFSIVGILATAVVVGVFVKYNGTPIIMASGRELCYVMMGGIMASYGITFVLVSRPTLVTCAIIRVGLGVSLCCIYAAILTKTSRLARVFTSQIKSAQRPRFITPKSQMVICWMIVSVQALGGIIWMIVEPPGTQIIYPSDLTAVLSCKVGTERLLACLSLNILLVVLCTYYAYLTRKIPENFNETKYIGFTMYATCIIWLAFVPIYFATQQHFRIQITSLSVCISLSGTVALGCFFAPKVYIVLFQPYKNVRNYKQKGAVGNLFSQQMNFISGRQSVVGEEKSGDDDEDGEESSSTLASAKDFHQSGMPSFVQAGAGMGQIAIHPDPEPEESTSVALVAGCSTMDVTMDDADVHVDSCTMLIGDHRQLSILDSNRKSSNAPAVHKPPAKDDTAKSNGEVVHLGNGSALACDVEDQMTASFPGNLPASSLVKSNTLPEQMHANVVRRHRKQERKRNNNMNSRGDHAKVKKFLTQISSKDATFV